MTYKIFNAAVVAALLLGAGCAGFSPGPVPVTPKACTDEAKICPDGSAVGRTGPNCEFSPCPPFTGTMTQAEAQAIAEKACIKGGEALAPGEYNANSQTWWFNANLNATRPGCSPACVVSEKTKTAEVNWRCTGAIEPSSPNAPPVACTMEARACPDGSYVGRQGPNCEFSPCPGPSQNPAPKPPGKQSGDIKIGQSITLGGLTIKPVQVAEDSRCPTDVTCVWAGQVRLTVLIAGIDEPATLTLGESYEVLGKNVTLVAVTPAPNSKVTIKTGDYRFNFMVVPAK